MTNNKQAAQKNIKPSVFNMIDLDRYPIHDLSSPQGKALIANCHQQLAETGACILPGFIKEKHIEMMAAQSKDIESFAVRQSCMLNTYKMKVAKGYHKEHPLVRKFPMTLRTLAYDQIPKESLLNELYLNDCLTEFVASALNLDVLYRYADEFQALNITFAGDGDQLAWHYDLNDFVVTLLLQEAGQGGEFEYAPNIRNKEAGKENFDKVIQLHNGEYPTRILQQKAGTLVFFKGINSMHRVRVVYGAQKRIMAILAYHRQADFKSADAVNVYLYGSRAQNALKKRRSILSRLVTSAALRWHGVKPF